MPTVFLTQVIDRPVADVFAIATDITTYPKWDPPVKSVKWDGRMGMGATYEMDVKNFGTMTFEVTEYAKDQVVRASPISKRYSGGHRLTFSEEGEGTRVDHEFVIEPKGVLRVLSPLLGLMAKREVAGSAAALKVYCEQR